MKLRSLDTKYTVAVFGCGSLGANIALKLARRMGPKVGFYLIDFDTIKFENLSNQPWFDVNIGQKKTDVLSSILWHQSKCLSETIHKRILIASDIDSLLSQKKVNIFIDCFDNGGSRKIIHKASEKLSIPIFHGGFSPTVFIGRWGDKFQINSDSLQAINPVCDRRDLATIVDIGASLSSESIHLYLSKKIQKNHFFELANSNFMYYS